MKKFILKRIISPPLRAGVRWYLSKPREYKYRDVTVLVMPGVFHPGFFYSTKLILEFLEGQNLVNQTFLELGSGSGLISIVASKMGARVTATDISIKAVRSTFENSRRNQVTPDVIHSDLFKSIPVSVFDWIVINPPYYASTPKTEADHAWYCGIEHEYFRSLFETIGSYSNSSTKVLMVLSEDCNLAVIFSLAQSNGFHMEKILERNVFMDGRNYLFWIKPTE